MIDLHNHILPGIDDGPKDLSGALEMARVAVASGIRTVAATPHINHAFDVAPEQIPVAVSALSAALAREGIRLRVVGGGEIAITRLMELDDEELASLRLGTGPWLLVESPLAVAPTHFDEIVLSIRARGHEVLLAHPERSVFFQRDPERLRALVDAGVRCSITASAMSGQFGQHVRRFALALLADGLVHDVSSDAHDHRRRPPVLLEPFLRAERDLPGIADQAEWYTAEAPEAILSGDPLPPPPAPPRRRRRTALGLPWRRA